MELTQTQLVIGIALVTTGTCIGLIIHKKNNLNSKEIRPETTQPIDTSIILDFFKDTDKEYSPKYLSYFIYKHGTEKGLLVSQLRLLDKEYGECLAEPVIDWRILISQLNNKQVENLLDTVKDYIRQNNDKFPTDDYDYQNLFTTYLRNKASAEATEIVAKVVQ
jgi:hypothetical protein